MDDLIQYLTDIRDQNPAGKVKRLPVINRQLSTAERAGALRGRAPEPEGARATP